MKRDFKRQSLSSKSELAINRGTSDVRYFFGFLEWVCAKIRDQNKILLL